MLKIKLINGKNSKLLNINLFLMTLLLFIPLLYGCSVSSTTENFEEKITNYESQIDKLNQTIVTLEKSRDYYKNYSFNCYERLKEKNKVIKRKEKEESYTNTESRFNYTWRGCRDDKRLSINIIRFNGVSMYPFLGKDHKVTWCIPSDNDDIYVGDIILYGDYNAMTAHQIIKKDWFNDEWVYITQGYNNPVNDMIVLTFDDIRGKLWKVEG